MGCTVREGGRGGRERGKEGREGRGRKERERGKPFPGEEVSEIERERGGEKRGENNQEGTMQQEIRRHVARAKHSEGDRVTASDGLVEFRMMWMVRGREGRGKTLTR